MRVRASARAALFFVLALPPGIMGQTRGTDSAAVEREIQNGVAALRGARYSEAKEHFEQAEKLAGMASPEINAGMAMSELQLGNYEVARQREAKVLETVSGDHARAEAHNIIGMSWLRESGQSADRAGRWQAAEDSFREALRLDPWFDSAHFNLGETLLREGRNAEASVAFKKFIEAAARDSSQDEGFPLRRQRPGPAFRVVDSEGHALSSDALRGRFVLLDFWATWCPPCIRALPVMRELAHYFPANQFTVISLDEDSPDEGKWRSFISREKTDWTQVWDKGSEVYFSFGLAPRPDLSLPRYVLLDPNNSVLRVYSGTDRLALVAGQIVRTVSAAFPGVAPIGAPQGAASEESDPASQNAGRSGNADRR